MKALTKEQFQRAEHKGFMTWQTKGGMHVIVTDNRKDPDDVEREARKMFGSGFLPVTPASPVERENAGNGQADPYYLK